MNSATPPHVYLRELVDTERSSLTVLAAQVPAGARVLDLGTGSGALGRHLSATRGCSVDGVTLSEEEAALARPHYQRIEIADLDHCDLATLFAGERYDRIVCADVLEHLKAPERVMQACRSLLTDEGQVLISVPNAAYAGLVAELMAGEFRYRDEGLLDRTHLRFFTRQSLAEFLSAQGWALLRTDTVERALPQSEFKVAFDALPAPVSRHLLGLPNALTYQLIAATRPGQVSAPANADASAAILPREALFTACLYLRQQGDYQEDDKRVASGVIGRERQQITFALPPHSGIERLRLDPADRSGFLYLYGMTLRDADGHARWEWQAMTDGLEPLAAMPQHQVLARPHWPGAAAAVMLMLGDDPWLELPPSAELLDACAGGALIVDLGWPMSADYLAMAQQVRPLAERAASLQFELDRLEQSQHAQQANHDAQRSAMSAALEHAKLNSEALRSENTALLRQQRLLQHDHSRLQREHDALARHLRWIENSTVFRMTRPAVHFKMWLQRQWAATPSGDATTGAADSAPARPVQAPQHPVDVIVPVYRGLDDTRCCIESVLASQCQTPWRLVVINDASPEPAVTEWLREVAAREPRITLLENEQNLGFVGTVNRGMALSGDNDVLLLNSDAEVANDWLDRLRRAAYSDARVASVTPFSNNATICSYPRFCEANEMPRGTDTATLDRCFAQANAGAVIDVPTGVGFCMYIRRDCLAQVGLFDVERFGKGYGEENDFCRRAAGAGWRNLHALDTFVRHAGGVSFGDSKSPREREAVQKLRQLHPGYETLVHRFVQVDPARLYRLRAAIARHRAQPGPSVLAVLHDRAGGTVRHVQELADHLQAQAQFFTLTPVPGAAVALRWLGDPDNLRLVFGLPLELDALLDALRAFGIAHVHFHHLLGHSPLVLSLPQRLGVRHDFTAHDYYAMCPQISLTDSSDTYCGEQGVAQCTQCLAHSPAPGGVDIETWRDNHAAVLEGARFVLAPSSDTARRFRRMFAAAPVRVAPHVDLPAAQALPVPAPRTLDPGATLKVVVIGALSRIKGADLLEDVARLAATQSVPVEFHLIGFGYRKLVTQPHAHLTVHGAYEEADLPGLLEWLQPDLAWFPAQWPETYSYTLSACLKAGLPLVVPDLGAFAERVQGRAWTWVRPWQAAASDWLAFFNDLRTRHFVAGVPPTAPWMLQQAQPSGQDAAWDYTRDYLDGVATLPAAELETAFLVRHLQEPAAPGAAAAQSALKRQALALLVRLRGSAALSGVARAIPLRWQTRVKSWLTA